MKKEYTIEEYYEKYAGKTVTVRLDISNPNCSKSIVEIVGYAEKSVHLIGRLRKNSGMTGHFKEPHSFTVINNHKEGNNYVFVNIRCLEKYPNLKKYRKRVELDDNIEDIDSLDLF